MSWNIKKKNYKDGANLNDTEQIEMYNDEVVRILQSIDFIYIDARHDFGGAYEDLSLYFTKVKCNGIIAGHDFQQVEEVLIENKGLDDFGLCANASRI